eukprot:3257911-Karenia_brevis.AAC.1
MPGGPLLSATGKELVPPVSTAQSSAATTPAPASVGHITGPTGTGQGISAQVRAAAAAMTAP